MILLFGSGLVIISSACDDVNIGTGGGDFFRPTVETDSLVEIGHDFATVAGEVTSDGGDEVSARGIVWSEQEGPSLSDAFYTEDGAGEGEFTSTITGLESSTQYHARSYATNSIGTAYGSELSFTTTEAQEGEKPDVNTLTIEDVTTTTAIAEGELVSEGDSPVTEMGFVWDTESKPDVGLQTKIQSEISTGVFSEMLSDLETATTYFVRAYAVNEYGISYGDELSFETEEETTIILPDIETVSVEEIDETEATITGNLVSSGGGTVTVKGFVWGTDPAPVIDQDNKTSEDGEPGLFSTTIDDLEPGVNYFVRAYATNEEGTAYGNELEFTTLEEDEGDIPTVTTAAVMGITSTGAISGGNVTDDGGSEVTSRGVVWSLNPDPDINSASMTVDGSGRGSFVSVLSDLIPSTKYYVRAYATNNNGTAYGPQLEFETESD